MECATISFSGGIARINNLNASSQTITTGTSGADFNISSSLDTHTLNLPVASASVTGKLSSTDWSTFNAKVPPTRTITINGNTQDLSADRSWTIITIVNWTEAFSSATQATSSWTPNNAAANVNAAIVPKGTGAITAAIPDGTATGGNARGTNAVDLQRVRGTAAQVASGVSSFIGGGQNNTANAEGSSVVAGYQNTASRTYSAVVGGIYNGASGFYSFVGAGYSNSASGNDAAIVVGGLFNSSSSQASFVGGGNSNTANNQYTTIGGGQSNTASGSFSAILGGQTNTASATYSVIVGGGNNQASGSYSVVGGGGDAGTATNRNVASGNWSTVVGGLKNTASGNYSVVGGQQNTASNLNGGIVAGYANNISQIYGFIGGGSENVVSQGDVNSQYGVVCGGFRNKIYGPYENGGFIGGGQYNVINNGWTKVICGGQNNTVDGSYSFIGGGKTNTITQYQIAAVIVGGDTNTVSNNYGTISGGISNSVSGQWGTISGGSNNTASGSYSSVTGGVQGTASLYGQQAYASGRFAANGDAQAHELIWRRAITGTAQTELFLDGASVQAILPATNTVWKGIINIAAVCTTAGGGTTVVGDVAAMDYTVTVKRIAGNTVLVAAAANISALDADPSMATTAFLIAANNTTEALTISCTPPTTANATTVIRVVATFRGLQIQY